LVAFGLPFRPGRNLVMPSCSIMFRWSCAAVQLVAVGGGLVAGMELVWPDIWSAEINKAIPTAKLLEQVMKKLGRWFIALGQ
jgi:hypothetical protein